MQTEKQTKSDRPGPKARAARKPKLTAASADKHVLYELSVQNVEHEIGFIQRVFRRMTGRKPLTLREDFCGTAKLCCEWVKRDRDRRATGIDLDARVLAWGERHNRAPLRAAADRVTLLNANVLDSTGAKYDVICAYNYSYFVFKTREALRTYFAGVASELEPDGCIFIDLFGGPDSQTPLEETRKLDGFTYVWDQAEYNPIDGHAKNYIHFRFRDGTKLDRAFTYDWRLWTIVELKELLREAGFGDADVYWEGEDEDGEGNGVFTKRTRVDNDPCWNAYLVARAATRAGQRERSERSGQLPREEREARATDKTAQLAARSNGAAKRRG